jgi:Ca-activated chloride channel homolog
MNGERMRRNIMLNRNEYRKNAVWLFAFALIASVVSFSAIGQTKRPRRTGEEQTPREPKPTPKPATPPPAPAGTPATEKPGAGAPAATQDPKKQPAEPEAEPIRIKTNLVTVPVSVTDINGTPIRNLTAEDFLLEEDGVKQQIQGLGEPGKTPIDLSLLFDVSRSIRNRFDFEREAAGRFLRQVLKPGDAISVYSIGSVPKLAIPRTENGESVIAGTQNIQPTEDSTAFFDTVVKASRYLSDNAMPGARRVMIILSDGEDTNSQRFLLGDAQRELQRGDALFYAINPSGPSIRLNKISTKGHEGMVRLANETGGLAFLPDKIEDLTQVFNQIGAELQAQYLLGYYSTNDANDGQLRKINVRVPKQGELRIRARKGYYAPKE